MIDSKALNETRGKISRLEDLDGTYRNSPVYVSRSKGFVGPSDMAQVLNFPYTRADSFRITGKTGFGLTIELLKDNQVQETCVFPLSSGLNLTPENLVELLEFKQLGSEDSPGFGYTNIKILLYLDEQGNLAVVNHGGGGGFATIIPMAVYGTMMGKFPRVEEE